MNREMRRLMEREERRQKNQEKGARRTPGAVARQQTGERKPLWQRIRSYFHEVRQALRRVSWPTRDQMIAFSTVTIITTRSEERRVGNERRGRAEALPREE